MINIAGVVTYRLPPSPISGHKVLKLVAIGIIVMVRDIVEFAPEIWVGDKLLEYLHRVAVPDDVPFLHPWKFGTFKINVWMREGE